MSDPDSIPPPTVAELARDLERAQLRLAEQRQLLARLVHDFRSPLNAIAGFAEIMETERFGPLGARRYVEYARDIRMSALQLAEIVADTLDGARFAAGNFHLDDEKLSIGSVVEAVFHTIKGLASAKRVGIDLQIQAEAIVVADRAALRQILLNLVSNAVKFTDPSGTISIRFYRNDSDCVVLEVADNGCGIAAEDIGKLTVAFAHSRRGSGGEAGTGLGLSIVAKLVELHGGTLAIDSALGEGTRVRVTLPAWRSHDLGEQALDWSKWP
jgi:two-component system, cell cycle sensor histidine kinase PleC